MLVSYYNHAIAIKHHFYTDSFANFFRVVLDEPSEAYYGSYFDYEVEMWKALQHLVDSGVVLNITFEDLKLKPAKTMKRIGTHLNLERNDEFYDKVSKRTSFGFRLD